MTTTIFHGGDILSLDPARPGVEAISVLDGKIAGLGPLAKLEAEAADAGSAAEHVDLGGGCLIPSLKDHHLHLTAVGLALLNEEEEERIFLDLAGADSADAIVARVAERAALVPEGEWIVGMGWNQHDWGTHQLPGNRRLSEAMPNHPVFLVRIDAHSAWVNEAALSRCGIDATTEAPHGGVILRLGDGAPSGVLLERAAEALVAEMPESPGWQIRQAFQRATEKLAASGVTEVFDAGFMAMPAIVSMAVNFELYLELLDWADAEAPLAVDVNLMVPSPSPLADQIVDDPGAYAELSPRHRVTHIKLYADGAFGSRGAALSHPYADDPSTRGLMRMTDEELVFETRRAIDAGLDVSTHAIGDDAVRRVLDAYEAVLAERPGADPRRFRIEHFAYASDSDIRRGADSGFLLVAQPNFIDPDPEGVTMEDFRLGARSGPRVYPWKTLLSAGASLALSSDYYVAPGPPLLDYYCAFTRKSRQGDPEEGWQPQERLSREESLALATTLHGAGGAPTTGGALRQGDPADLAILSANPLSEDETGVLDIGVHATFRRGEITYSDGSLQGT